MNQWVKGFCRKREKISCGKCDARKFVPVSDNIIAGHLKGIDVVKNTGGDFTIGVYPLLLDETCWFLAVDFDKDTWKDDSVAYIEVCESFNVPASLERSRSGNGGHVWIFFAEAIPAKLARQLGSYLLTQAMEKQPGLGFRSYDRLFPSQDIMPNGGFGNLIALPLQKRPRENGNSVFVDKNFIPHSDQWAFLSSIRAMKPAEVEIIVKQAAISGGPLGVRYSISDEDEAAPWRYSPSGRKPDIPIKCPLPDHVKLIIGNQIYIAKDDLPPVLLNRLIRLAAFQNPKFYEAQAMRRSTYKIPRIMHCCEDFPKHIGLPRGCMEDVEALFSSLNIHFEIVDERFSGSKIDFRFTGALRAEQKDAVEVMLQHDMGVLSASTAFGKTVIAAFLIAKRSVNTLVLVHRKQLLDQWIVRLSEFLDIPQEMIGQIGDGKRNLSGKIDVGTIQSISRKGVVDDIVADYGHIVVDECHHISPRSFEIAVRQSKAKFVTGLSATVTRKDGHHPIIFMNCGPVRYKVHDRKQAANRPFEHKVNVRKTGFRLPDDYTPEEYPAINEIYSFLTNDEDRNRSIVNDIIKVVANKRFPLVLTERREHIDTIYSLLEGKIENIIILKGGMGKKQKRAVFKALEELPDNSEKVILATGKYIGEGFDEKRLDTLFLTLPISWKGTISQYAGRLHRINDTKKEVVIYDYVDLNVPMLKKMYSKRISGYKSIGYEIAETE